MKEAVLVIALVALVAGAMAIAMAQFKSDWSEELTTTAVTDEALTYVNGTAVALANPGTAVLTCSVVTDGNGTTISSGNYTCEEGIGITVTNEGGWTDGHNDTVYINYSYAEGDYSFNITGQGEEGTSNMTTFLGTIGTIIGVVILVGIVVGAFAFGRR